MPLALFRSKTRQVLMELFFTNPNERYYVRQLQAMLNISVGTIHREIKGLEDIGILTGMTQANIKFYSANKTHPLFQDLRNIVAKTLGVETALKETLAEIPGIKLAFTYGSFVSGQETARGVINMCVMGRFDEELLGASMQKLGKRLKRRINCAPMSETKFRRELKKHPPELLDIFTEQKTFLIGEGSALIALAG